MEAPAKVAIGSKHAHNITELTASPTKVTIGNTYIHNIMDIDTKQREEENGGEKGNYGGDNAISSPNNLNLGWVSRHVEAGILTGS